MRTIVNVLETGIEYSGRLSPRYFALCAMNKMRIAVRPPERTPPTPRTFVKFAE